MLRKLFWPHVFAGDWPCWYINQKWFTEAIVFKTLCPSNWPTLFQVLYFAPFHIPLYNDMYVWHNLATRLWTSISIYRQCITKIYLNSETVTPDNSNMANIEYCSILIQNEMFHFIQYTIFSHLDVLEIWNKNIPHYQ